MSLLRPEVQELSVLSENRTEKVKVNFKGFFKGEKDIKNRGKTNPSGLVGVLLSTAFPLHPDCCHYCQLAQHMAHGT